MAWALPQQDKNAPWLVYFHGNGENVSSYLSFTAQLYAMGVNVLMPEYRGYGESGGEPSEAGLYQDADANYQYLIDQGVSPDNIILYGFSLGSGVATDLASRKEVGGLILEAAFTSLPDAARAIYRVVPTGLMANRFASIEKIDQGGRALCSFCTREGISPSPFRRDKRFTTLPTSLKHLLRLKAGILRCWRGRWTRKGSGGD